MKARNNQKVRSSSKSSINIEQTNIDNSNNNKSHHNNHEHQSIHLNHHEQEYINHHVSGLSDFKYIIPSLFTMMALCFGISAVRQAIQNDFKSSMMLMVFSAICDGLDGHVARYLDAATLFGGELDSLCDLVDFGAAPALVMYEWITLKTDSHQITNTHVWICCCCFVASCAYRLARYNVGSLHSPRPLIERTFPAERPDASLNRISFVSFKTRYLSRSKFFCGVPAPVGGFMAMFPIVYELTELSIPNSIDTIDFLLKFYISPRGLCCLLILLVAGAMVSNIPTISGKLFMKDPTTESHLRNRSIFTFLLKCLTFSFLVFIFIWYPWKFLLFVHIANIVMIIFAPFMFKYLAK